MPVLLVAALSGCGARTEIAPPPSPPPFPEPSFAIPEDLDLVLRLDLERAKNVLGESLSEAFDKLLRAAPESAGDAQTNRLLLTLLSRTETLWLGVRPGLSTELTDNVIVLRGDFSEVFPNPLQGGEPPWGEGRDLGGGVLRFERPAPKLRAAPAVLYYAVPDRVVIGSYAEIDALERSLERAPSPALATTKDRLVPPETGIASMSARLDSFLFTLHRKAKTVAKLLDGAERLSASASWTGAAFDLRAELRFEADERAREVAELLAELARAFSKSGHAWLGSAQITPVGQFVSLQLEVPASLLAKEVQSGTVAP